MLQVNEINQEETIMTGSLEPSTLRFVHRAVWLSWWISTILVRYECNRPGTCDKVYGEIEAKQEILLNYDTHLLELNKSSIRDS